MPKLRTLALTCGASLLFAGAAVAAEALRTMEVDLPDGSVAHVTYTGDVAPRVAIAPMEASPVLAYDPFLAMEREFAAMRQRHAQMLQRVAELQRDAATSAQSGRITVSGDLPAASSYSYTVVSSSNGRNTCTQTVQWSSDGSSAAPKVTRASSGDCDAIQMNERPVPASAPSERAPPHDPRSI